MNRLARLVRFAVLAVSLFSLAAHAADDAGYPKGQLPDGIAPTHYAIHLTVLPDRETFSGEAVIDLKLDHATNVIWMHGRDLKVSAIAFRQADGKRVNATWREIPGSDGVAKVTLAKAVNGGNATLTIRYTAPFNRELEGLYRADEGGKSYAYSQMEPIDARRAFPGFDEPRFKTPFDISLTVRASHAAISNAPAANEEMIAGGLKRVTFATTKPLPTYLIAFAVGPFDVVDWQPIPPNAVRNRPVPLRGITVKGKGEQVKYALAHTAGLLETLEQYFGTPYPYEKLDLIAALDFSAGAMENAGAIVYRELFLLVNDQSPLWEKREYALGHAHEMSHQWVGDLVTPKWWNDLWLNESFATWMEDKTTAAWEPNGEYGRLSLTGALGAMSADAEKSARRITQPIESNDDIENAFDSITYDKGAAVLAMFEHYYGPEVFRKGVQLHLARHVFGTATAADFLKAVADASGDAKGTAAFESFLDQAGVPLVQADLDCGAGAPHVALHQSRYVETGNGPAPDQSWKIPMCIAFGDADGRNETCALVEDKQASIALPTKKCPAWIMPNADGASYVRFTLGKSDWDALVKNAGQLTDREVLASLDSLYAAFDAGAMDIGDYLDRVKGLLAPRTITWDMASMLEGPLAWVRETLAPPEARAGVEAYIRALYEPLYAKVGPDANSPLDQTNAVQATLLRTPVVTMVALYGGLPAARAELARRGAAYLGLAQDGKPGDGKLHPDAIDPNLASQAAIVAVEEFGMNAAEAIIAQLKTERNAVVRSRLLGALTRSTDPKVAARARALALSNDLRVNERPILIDGATSERANIPAGWAWFKANFDAIKAKTPAGERGDLVAIGDGFCTAAERDDLKAFFAPRIDGLEGGRRELAEVIESINTCVALVEAQQTKAAAYFAKVQ